MHASIDNHSLSSSSFCNPWPSTGNGALSGAAMITCASLILFRFNWRAQGRRGRDGCGHAALERHSYLAREACAHHLRNTRRARDAD
eukprot:3893566-Pyramimonas_sp.AAC.1